MSTAQTSRVNILQALRAYASLPIIFFHTGFVVAGLHSVGVFGVHTFFVMSGFIMASICATNTHAFMRRRLIRILPSYWAMTILLYFVALKFPAMMNATRAVPVELIKSLLFIPFAKSNGLYQPILFVGWTINFEIFFYVVLALSLMVYRRHPLYLASVILASVFLISRLFAAHSDIAAFYADPAMLEFILGLFSYYCVSLMPLQTATRLRPLWLTLLITAVVAMPVIEAFRLLPGLPTVVQFGPLSFLVIWSSCVLALSGADLGGGLLVLIGDASYTLYLSHPYIELFLDRIVAKHFHFFHIRTAGGCIFAMLASVVFSILFYLKVEKPGLRYLNKRFCGPARPATISAALSPYASSPESPVVVPAYK